MIPKPCLTCGRRTDGASRCARHTTDHERERQARQGYRIAYFTPERRRARREVLRRDGGRCQRVLEGGELCGEPATEVHELRPISRARNVHEAVLLGSDPTNMVGVCARHNPRGQRRNGAPAEPPPPDDDGPVSPSIG